MRSGITFPENTIGTKAADLPKIFKAIKMPFQDYGSSSRKATGMNVFWDTKNTSIGFPGQSLSHRLFI